MRRFGEAEIYALLAAIANGTIGPLNRFAFQSGATHEQIAFFKCFGAFALLGIFCIMHASSRVQLIALSARAPVFALLSVLGVFSLYFFETWAFAQASIPLVSFLTYAAGAITLVLSALVLKERITIWKGAAFILILGGVCAIFYFEGTMQGSTIGVILALLGGLGYALFIFFAKKFDIGSGLPQLVWLFGFGSVYLALPLATQSIQVPPVAALWPICALIVVPTIGGFWLTTRAVSSGNASNVQIIETSDPLFASLFAIILFNETLASMGWFGAGLIMVGILFAIKQDRPLQLKTV